MNFSEQESPQGPAPGLQMEGRTGGGFRLRPIWLAVAFPLLVLFTTLLMVDTSFIGRSLDPSSRTMARFVANSDVIVVAQVDSVQSAYNPQRTFIFTRVTLRPLVFIKGNSPGPLVLRHFGGVVGQTFHSKPGTPSFNANDEVLVFLVKSPDSHEYVLYSAMGKFTIVPRGSATVAVIDPAYRELDILNADAEFLNLISRSEREELLLNDLIGRIRQL